MPEQTNQPASSIRLGVHSPAAHLAMCAATAVLLTLAYPLPGWSFMAFFALVPVGVLALRTRRLWTLAWTSYLVFFVWWALRVMWLRHVQPVAPLGMALVCAAYFTVALVALAAAQRRFRGAMTITLPLFWCAQELARSVWPMGGFAWFTLASSQAAWSEGQHPGYLVQSADLFGWVGVSFLLAMTSGLIVDLIARPLAKRLESGALRPRRTILVAVVLWAVFMSSAMVYGYQRIQGTPTAQSPDARRVNIGIVQTNVPQSNKRQGDSDDLFRSKLEDLDQMLALSEASAQDEYRPDLIVWPETMVTFPINDESLAEVIGDAQPPDPAEAEALYRAAVKAGGGALEALPPYAYTVLVYRNMVQSHVDRLGVPVVVGSQARGFASHDRSMNSALYVQPGDTSWSRYSKMHLVPFGEYIPGPGWMRDLFLNQLSPYDYDYTVQPGEGVVIFEVDPADAGLGVDGGAAPPVRFATPICYEDAVAIQCRKMVYGRDGDKRVDLLVNLTNDGWYPNSHQGYQHLQIAAMRAIENRVPMVRSVNTGVSGLIDSAGRVGPLVGVDGEHQAVAGHVNVVVVLDERASLYGTVREGFGVGLSAAAALMLIGVFVPGTSRRRGAGQPAGKPGGRPVGRPDGRTDGRTGGRTRGKAGR